MSDDEKKPAIFQNTPASDGGQGNSGPSAPVRPPVSAAPPERPSSKPALEDMDDFDDLDEALDSDLDDFSDDLEPLETEFNEDDFDDFDAPQDAPPAAKKHGAPAAAKQKSFFMKHFNVIVIGLGVLGAVFIFMFQIMGSMTGGSRTPTQEEQAMADGSVLPQPAPIAPAEQPPAPGAVPQREVLTPMPEPDQQTLQTAELPNLDIDADPQVAAEMQEMAMPEDEPLELAQPAQDQIPAAPEPDQSLTSMLAIPEAPEENTGEAQPEPGLELAQAPEPVAEPAPEEIAAADEAAELPGLVAFEEELDPTVDEPVNEAEPEPMPEMVTEQEPEPQQPAEPSAPIEPPAAEAKPAPAADPELDEKIKAANERIAQLTSMLEDMENKIEELEAEEPEVADAPEPTLQEHQQPQSLLEPEPAPAAVVTPTRRPELVPAMKSPPVSETRAAEKAPAKAPVLKAASGAAPATHAWTLRSAQIGRAVVSDKATGDLRSVEVGSTLPGIGKILSIAPENGRWIVRGTNGEIRQ